MVYSKTADLLSGNKNNKSKLRIEKTKPRINHSFCALFLSFAVNEQATPKTNPIIENHRPNMITSFFCLAKD